MGECAGTADGGGHAPAASASGVCHGAPRSSPPARQVRRHAPPDVSFQTTGFRRGQPSSRPRRRSALHPPPSAPGGGGEGVMVERRGRVCALGGSKWGKDRKWITVGGVMR